MWDMVINGAYWYGISIVLFVVLWRMIPKHRGSSLGERQHRPSMLSLQDVSMKASWHREQMEALAEHAVELSGYSYDPESIQAELAREIVYCGRTPDDAMERIGEVERTFANVKGK